MIRRSKARRLVEITKETGVGREEVEIKAENWDIPTFRGQVNEKEPAQEAE